ncbi:hypothetical protein [Streptomyces sp. NBC_00568]|uniref:hypothetical protein n=1 Tax=Streptomyces sp. NBC_00568 TaxID=2975779 RepID=UPI002253660C|nr:hypothetical protein [Streptomyces sp. NBC_00568]MCX4988456.1 hypothetical protein [Streptomyces sp. NBC_00568]
MLEIEKNPDVEVGGKFVGYIRNSSPVTRRRKAKLADLEVEVCDYLDSGPGTSRSAVFHHPDTEYQLELFQRIEREFPGLAFIGLWHSHHPNGFPNLSRGDIQAHWGTVNSPRYDQEIMISSLAIDDTGILGGKTFAFPRGSEKYYEIAPDSIQVVRTRNDIHAAVEAHAKSLRSRTTSRTGGGTSTIDANDTDWRHTSEGQNSLARDQAWLAIHPGMQPYTRRDTVIWRGSVRRGSRVFQCAYTYPEDFPKSSPFAAASLVEEGIEVTISVDLAESRTRPQEFLMLLDELGDTMQNHIEKQIGDSRNQGEERDV